MKKGEKQKVKRISLRLRDGCPEHQILLRNCQKRDKEKFHSMTDYIACAVDAFESGRYMTIQMDVDTMTEKEQMAVNILLQHNNTKKEKE